MNDNTAHRFMERLSDGRDWYDDILICCPKCGRQAHVLRLPENEQPLRFGHRRIVCRHCGYSRSEHFNRWIIGNPIDPFYYQPLWLMVPCCGTTLWAYSLPHATFLEAYTQAMLREHRRYETGWSNNSPSNRLPHWMKEAGNRETIARCIGKLRQRACEISP